MSPSVTKYLPQIFSASSCPLAINRRKAGAPIEPSGKASWAAVSRRSGVVEVTVSGAGRFIAGHWSTGMKGRRGLLGHRRTYFASAPSDDAVARNF
jgi:hypothetical protein